MSQHRATLPQRRGPQGRGRTGSIRDRNIQKTVLPNGLVVVTETMPQVRSVCVGIWLGHGSRVETPEQNGITHFIEHMVFKGTRNRTAEQIARSMDSIGGHMDAFTGKECVCFSTVVLDEHLPLAFDVLSDLVLNPRFDNKDILRERGVILEEIKSEEDNPDYLLHEIFTQNFWKGHPLGQPILGTRRTVGSFEKRMILRQFDRHYRPNHMVIAAAGNVRHPRLLELAGERFHQLTRAENHRREPAPVVQPRITLRNKESLEQVHLCLGVPAYPLPDERRYASYILNALLGGGMSSRLFQNIRERQGLAYAVFSELAPYRDTGCLFIYAGTSLGAAQRVVRSVVTEFRDLKENPIPAEELRRAKDHLKGSLMLSLESTGSRMSNLARQEMYFDRFFDLDEIIAKIEAVTAEEVAVIARDLFRPENISLTVLGRLNGLKISRKSLSC